MISPYLPALSFIGVEREYTGAREAHPDSPAEMQIVVRRLRWIVVVSLVILLIPLLALAKCPDLAA
jgi:hypothetical protein